MDKALKDNYDKYVKEPPGQSKQHPCTDGIFHRKNGNPKNRIPEISLFHNITKLAKLSEQCEFIFCKFLLQGILGDVLQVERKVVACGNFNCWENIRGARKETTQSDKKNDEEKPISISNVAFRLIETSKCGGGEMVKVK